MSSILDFAVAYPSYTLLIAIAVPLIGGMLFGALPDFFERGGR